jgi:hypothetical protein
MTPSDSERASENTYYGIGIDDGASEKTGRTQDALVGIIRVRDSNSKVEKVCATKIRGHSSD